MRSTPSALVVCSIMVCVASLFCQCSSLDALVPAKTAEPVLFREDKLVARVKNLKRGDSMQRCSIVLGEPTDRVEEREKWAPRGQSRRLSAIIYYYVVRQHGAHLNDSKDRFLTVRFDADGRMQWTEWHGQP